MVFYQFNGENSHQEEKEKISKEKITKRIFTLTEIENQQSSNSILASTISKTDSMINNLKHIDSAVLFSSSTNNKMTRYDKADLIALKDSKLSKEPPRCFYDTKIMQLNILKYRANSPESIEAQMKMFKEKLQNMMYQQWDPNTYYLLRQYHNILLNPNPNGQIQFPQMSQQQSIHPIQQQHQMIQPSQIRRRVSFGAADQQAVLDKIPTYDRNTNFFDNITTTAITRPPVPQRYGDENAAYHKFNHGNRRFFNNNNNKTVPMSMYERQSLSSVSYNSSGYYSGNDSSHLSQDSMNDGMANFANKFSHCHINEMNKMRNAEKTADSAGDEEHEPEPEWFNVPVTRNDFVDLRGFDGEEKSAAAKDDGKQNSDVSPRQANDQRYGNSPYNNSYRRNTNYSNRQYVNNNGQNSPYRNMNNYQNQPPPPPNVQRFRNPLHYSKPGNQMPTQANNNFANVHHQPNPFFDAWRSGKFLNQQNINFSQLIDQANIPTQSANFKHISDVEQSILNNAIYNPNTLPVCTQIPQFFQNLANNWGVRLNNQQQQYNEGISDGFTFPTREQLEIHTSEIMKNAMLRKQRDQQYHDENNH